MGMGVPLSFGISARDLVSSSSLGQLRVVATRGVVMGEGAGGGVVKGGGAPNDYTRGESRVKCFVGRAAASGIRLVFTNWYVGASGVGEVAGDNAITVEAGIETSVSPFYTEPVTFNGASSITIAPGATVVSDPIGKDFAAGAAFWVRTGVTVSSAQTWPAGAFSHYSGERGVESGSGSSQITGTGALTTPGGGAIVPFFFAPVAVVGYLAVNAPSVGILGDSIGRGYSDTGGIITGAGWVVRGLDAINGYNIPWVNLSRSSDTALANTADDGLRKRRLIEYVNTVIIELGGNDASASVATVQARFAELIAACRARPGVQRVLVSTFPPRTTSTDSWATAANQTPVANYGVGEWRDEMNTWLRANAGGLADACLDPCVYLEDPSAPNKIVSNGTPNWVTNDGVHFNTTGSVLAAQCLSSIAATW